MTRMSFGLNVTPKIMSRVLSRVLSLDKDIELGTDHYIDDTVNEDVVSAATVRLRLFMYGLKTKEPESIDNARILGLRATKNQNSVMKWSRDCTVIECPETVTKRELCSVCAKLVGYYLLEIGFGWLVAL